MMPVVGINFKTSKKGTGKNALKLLRILNKFRNKANMLVGVHDTEYIFAKKFKIPFYAQHFDFSDAKWAKAFGLKGTFLNHSDHRLRFDLLKKRINECKKEKLKCLVFVASLAEAKKVLPLKPDYVAYEDPFLIGGKKSITKYMSDKVAAFAKLVGKKSIPLCGAGIHEAEDLKEALRLGCKGILMSSAFVKARNPDRMMKNFLSK